MFVLAMLVLVLAIVLAFFSRAALNRQIASASTADTKVRLISQAAEGYILDDIQREIEAGSTTVSPTNLSVQIRRPITLTNVGVGVTNTWAPSMVPQRAGVSGFTNIVKISRGGQPFFTNGPGYNATGTVRASAIPTTNASINGKFLTKDRWNLPKLMGDAETNSFVAPDWIYIDRQGNSPTNFSTLSAMASPESTNTNYVIGRYAFVIYDVGGLIDINVAGNRLPDADNSRRGRLNQVSITNPILGIANFTNFVAWRSAFSSTNTNATAGSGGLFDPTRTFIDVPPGEQAFVSRQDLLAYVASTNSIATNALPFLTTFSRDLNAPSYEPNPARSKLPATPVADDMNPALLSIRFAADTTLQRPEGNITVKSGSPVMPRRFPLSKLSLFEQANPDPAAMSYYFGLTKVDSHTWTYNATTSDGRIAMLSEVAAMKPPREPNFFEILQAVILTGSLGKSADDTYTYDKIHDGLQNLQILQIAANIIDQWDANDFPTCIQFPSGNPGDPFSVFGIENLPYISQIGLAGWRPTDNRDLFQVWALFDIWNPHQNAKTPPSGIDGFRIVPISGNGTSYVRYQMSGWDAIRNLLSPFTANLATAGGTRVAPVAQSIVTLNASRNFSFPATTDYSEPTTLGGIPSSSSSSPGLLLMECTPGIAIPPPGERTASLQININNLMYAVAPYTANIPPGPPMLPPLPNLMGQWVYPAGTEFTDVNPTYWTQSGLTIWGNYGVKAHNEFRLLRRDAAPYCFDLQARHISDGQWRTYQRFEDFSHGLFQQTDIASSPVNGLSSALGGEGVTIADTSRFFTNTHHSAGGPLQNEFYTWRSRGASVGMIKADPRTGRFGISNWNNFSSTPVSAGNDFLGLSVRDSASPFTGSPLSDRRWQVSSSGWAAGFNSTLSSLVGGFELVSGIAGLTRPPLFGLASNNPDVLDAANPSRYSDPDGVIRPGDGYFGALPTVRGRFADRPILLNRPFRTVGELGHVFRDVPWKSLDFSTRRSGDLGLLDVFSISETDGDPPLTAGQINLNTRQTAALATVLQNSSKQLAGVNPGVPSSELTVAQAQTLAQAIVDESSVRPFADKGDLVTRVLNAGTGTDPLAADTMKTAREAAVRALAEIGTTRTWNFLIDLVAQSGRFTASSGTGSDFLVQGEERVWIHVAIDRMTGEVLELRREVVNE